MKIRDLDMSHLEPRAPLSSEVRRENAAPVQAFSRQMTDLSQNAFMTHIGNLADQIYRQGELVAKRADIKELQKYRELITQLLNEAVSNGYVFEKKGSFDLSGRHRVFALIKNINSKLDEITSALLNNQADNISLLSAVDDIRGMLVDLLY